MALVAIREKEEYKNEGIVEENDLGLNDSSDLESSDGAEGETAVCNKSESNNNDKFPMTEKEISYGIDLDLFGRFAPNKIPKKYGKPIYHYHVEPSIRDLQFIWNEIKCKELNVQHLDRDYTVCRFIGDEHHQKNYNLVTRRCVWPLNYQNKMYETNIFKYNLEDINKYFKMAIILVHGGRFAIAVYHGAECMYHKTERAYVVRRNRNGGRRNIILSNKTKKECNSSAGSSKRAWNEKHLKENIQEILSQLQDDLESCGRIFIHAPSACNQVALFGDKNEQSYLYPDNENLMKQRLQEIRNKNTNKQVNQYRLFRKDPRIMTIPMTTYNATFAEVERVHHYLTTCWLNIN